MVAVVDDVALGNEVLAAEDKEAWRCWGARALTVLARPSGRLLAAVAVVAGIDAEAVESAEGGCGGRKVVVEVRKVAVDLARVCAFAPGDCNLEVGVDTESVDTMGEGRDEEDGPTIDFGLVNLVGRVRVLLTGSEPCAAAVCFEACRAAVEFDRLSPIVPEFCVLLVPIADVAAA